MRHGAARSVDGRLAGAPVSALGTPSADEMPCTPPPPRPSPQRPARAARGGSRGPPARPPELPVINKQVASVPRAAAERAKRADKRRGLAVTGHLPPGDTSPPSLGHLPLVSVGATALWDPRGTRLISSFILHKQPSNGAVYRVHTHIDTVKCYGDKL